MDVCSCVKIASQDFGPRMHNPCFCLNLPCMGLGAKYPSTCNVAEETGDIMSLEDLNISGQGGIDEEFSLKAEELGISLTGLLHAQVGVHGHPAGHDSSSDQNAICNLDGDDTCQDLKILQSASLDANIKKSLNRSTTFPCSGKVQQSPIDGSEGILTASLRSRSSSEPDSPIYTRSTSLPATLKLVSAMKGSREQQGLPRKMKLNVKWAPDVYDPPATSMPHTVNSHHQRPRSKKKDHQKHKHKGKSSKGGADAKKQAKRRSTGNITDPLTLRLQAPGNRLLLDGPSQCTVEVVDYARGGQKYKWGSCFLVGSPAKAHFSVAEAS